MRCTECNKEVRPVVAIDIDGTIGRYHEHFLQFAANYLDEPLKHGYQGAVPFKEWFCREYECSHDTWHDIKLAYRQGGMKRSMPMYVYAPRLCYEVMKRAELWLTTTRPYIRHDNVDPDTREWLRRHSISYDYLIYDGDKYKKLRQLVGQDRVVAVLDDLLEEVLNAELEFGPTVPILRRTIWNQDVGYDNHQAVGLEDALRIIVGRIAIWEREYGISKVN